MTTAPFLTAPPADAPHAADTANGTPDPDRDGAAARERGHDKHRRRCRRDMRVAAHAIIDRLLTAGSCVATDLDDLPPAPSGSRTYIGTAFLDLRRNGVIRTAGPPEPTTAGGRHAAYLHRWILATDAAAALAYKLANPIPPVEAGDAPTLDDNPANGTARPGPSPRRADGSESDCPLGDATHAE